LHSEQEKRKAARKRPFFSLLIPPGCDESRADPIIEDMKTEQGARDAVGILNQSLTIA
jgi:hypothetical protein